MDLVVLVRPFRLENIPVFRPLANTSFGAEE